MSPSSTQTETNDFVIANGNNDSHSSEFKNNQASHPTYPNLSNENCNNNKSNRFKPFICTQCSKSYTTPLSLNRHHKNVHNIILPPVKRLSKKIMKSKPTDLLNKEGKKFMKSQLEKEGKKLLNQRLSIKYLLQKSNYLKQHYLGKKNQLGNEK